MHQSYQGFKVGDRVRRKGKLVTIVSIDDKIEPASLTVCTDGPDSHEIETEFHLIEKISELELHLQKNGKNNQELNKWKIKIYGNNQLNNVNIETSKTNIINHYDHDLFCYQYLLFKKCNNQENCQDEHKEYINDMLTNGLIERSMVLLNYLEWYYSKNKNSLYKIKVDRCIRDVFKDMASESKQFGNWPNSIDCYLNAIKGCEQVAVDRCIECHFLFGKILKYHGLLDQAIYHYYQALIQCHKNLQNKQNENGTFVNENNMEYLLQFVHCLYLQDCNQHDRRLLCLQIYEKIFNLEYKSVDKNSPKMRTILNITKLSINEIKSKIRHNNQSNKHNGRSDEDYIVTFILDLLHEKTNTMNNLKLLSSPEYYSMFNLLAKMNVDVNKCKHYLMQMGSLDDSLINRIHCDNLCVWWSIFGKCNDIEFNFVQCSGNHSNSNMIASLIDNKQFDQAWNLCKYFEDSISNKLNKINKDLSILIRIESQLYEYFGDIYNYHNGSRSDRDYKISQYCYCKSINLYCNNNKCIIKLAKLMNNHFKNHFQSISLFDFILNNNYKSKSIDPSVYFEYAMVLKDSGQIDKSVKQLEKAIDHANHNDTLIAHCKEVIDRIKTSTINDKEFKDESKQNCESNNYNLESGWYPDLRSRWRLENPWQINERSRKWIHLRDEIRNMESSLTFKFPLSLPPNWQSLIDKLKSRGYKDETLMKYKIQLYNGDFDRIVKHFEKDEFCHRLATTGGGDINRCNQCEMEHNLSIAYLIANKNTSIKSIRQALFLVEYMFYSYTKNQNYDNPKIERNFIAGLYDNFGDIVLILAQNNEHYKIACQCFMKRYDYCPNYSQRHITHAKTLDWGLQDWNTAMCFYEKAIQWSPMSAYSHFTYGMAALEHRMLDKAGDMFAKAIKLKHGNRQRNLHSSNFDAIVGYYMNYGYVMYLKGKQFYKQSIKLYEKALKLHNSGVGPASGNQLDKTKYLIDKMKKELKRSGEYDECDSNRDGDNKNDEISADCRRNKASHANGGFNSSTRPKIDSNYNEAKNKHKNVNINTNGSKSKNTGHGYSNKKGMTKNQQNQNKHNYKPKKSIPKFRCEFDRFWSKLSFGNSIKARYYQMFVKNKMNDIQKLLNQYDQLSSILANQIGMNLIHSKYFLKQCSVLNIKYLEFKDWFHHWPQLNEVTKQEYLQVLLDNKIYTFESFRFYVDSPVTLEKILVSNCNQYQQGDANIIFDSVLECAW